MKQDQTTSQSDNGVYPQFCKAASESDEIFANFKVNPQYRRVLEHVSPKQGLQYYQLVKDNTPEYAARINELLVNDRLGSPAIAQYPFGTFSPTTLRYAKVASDLKVFFGGTKGLRVIEIGGGYGGQALVNHTFDGFQSWTIVDLSKVVLLQERYLNAHGTKNVNFIPYDASFPNDLGQFDLVVSSYGFSECARIVQEEYLTKVLERSTRGYLTLNFMATNRVVLQNRITRDGYLNHINGARFVDEEPLTHPGNVILIWGDEDA